MLYTPVCLLAGSEHIIILSHFLGTGRDRPTGGLEAEVTLLPSSALSTRSTS